MANADFEGGGDGRGCGFLHFFLPDRPNPAIEQPSAQESPVSRNLPANCLELVPSFAARINHGWARGAARSCFVSEGNVY